MLQKLVNYKPNKVSAIANRQDFKVIIISSRDP